MTFEEWWKTQFEALNPSYRRPLLTTTREAAQAAWIARGEQDKPKKSEAE